MSELNFASQKKVTFARLDEALTALGFTSKKVADYTAFREKAHDAVIVLPAMRPTDVVSEPHMIVVHNTVTGKGVATVDELRTRLHPARSTLGLSSSKRRAKKPITLVRKKTDK